MRTMSLEFSVNFLIFGQTITFWQNPRAESLNNWNRTFETSQNHRCYLFSRWFYHKLLVCNKSYTYVHCVIMDFKNHKFKNISTSWPLICFPELPYSPRVWITLSASSRAHFGNLWSKLSYCFNYTCVLD